MLAVRSGYTKDFDRGAMVRVEVSMRRWTHALPGASGPGVLRAELLFVLGLPKQADVLLATTRAEVFHEAGRDRCDVVLAERALEARQFATVLDLLRRPVGREPDRKRLWQLVEPV